MFSYGAKWLELQLSDWGDFPEMSTDDKLTELDVHNRMTVDEALQLCRRAELKEVIIIGFDKDDEFFTQSSKMTRQDALWALEWAKRHTLGLLND